MLIIYSYPSNAPQQFNSQTDSVILGRAWPDQPVDLDLSPDGQVSRRHARLTYEGGGYWVEDLGSKHGTWVNEQSIQAKTRLKVGDQVRLGQTLIKVGLETELTETGPAIPNGDISYTIDATTLPFGRTNEEALDGKLVHMQRQLKAFYQLSQALGQAPTLESLLQTLVEQLQQAIPNAQRGAILLRDETGELLLKAHWPLGEHSVSRTLAERASAERSAFIWTMSDNQSANTPLSVLHYRVESAIYTPLLGENQVLGVVYVDNYGLRQAFTPSDVELLLAIANQAAMFVKNHALKQQLQYEATIRSNLLRQFSPQLAERLLQDQGRLWLGGRRVKPITILILDIRSFTTLAAEMAPDDVVEVLNELFGICVPIIFKYDGVVDKYVGDSILAVFGSPEPDREQWAKAVHAAIEIQQATCELGNKRQSRNEPIYQVGIGIHSGEAVHGFIGSPERMEYTVVGDTVNQAARYCDGADKEQIIISRAVYEHVYRLVEVTPKKIKTKHQETEPDLETYVVKGLKKNAG